jgi:hypothetical protein
MKCVFSPAKVGFAAVKGVWHVGPIGFVPHRFVAVVREDMSALWTQSEDKRMVLEASGCDVEIVFAALVAQLEITNERLKGLSDNILAVDQRLSGGPAEGFDHETHGRSCLTGFYRDLVRTGKPARFFISGVRI